MKLNLELNVQFSVLLNYFLYKRYKLIFPTTMLEFLFLLDSLDMKVYNDVIDDIYF